MKIVSCGIYKIINTLNGKFYIGSSKNIHKRWRQHLSHLRTKVHNNIILQRVFDKYGVKVLKIVIIENCDQHNLFKREQHFIDTLKPPYNIGKKASGGDNLTGHPNRDEIIGRISKAITERMKNLTAEDRKKLSEDAMGEKNPNFGNKWSKKQRDHMRKILKTIWTDEQKQKSSEEMKRYYQEHPETRQKISIAASKRTGKKNPFYNKKHSKKSKNKMSKATTDKWNNMTPEERADHNPQVRKVSINTQIYYGVTEAARQLGVCPATICFRIKSKNKKFAEYFYCDQVRVKPQLSS